MKLPLHLLAFVAFTFYGVTSFAVTLGGYIDTYYALDSNAPSDNERASFQTQPARHNEFDINLAYAEALLKEDDRRGRLALQFGSSVDRNYASENNKSLQTLQEAYIGIRLTEKLWMDAGIFFSHIGIESFISKKNINYTRSLNADNVPYYASGVKFEYEKSRNEVLQFHVLNGWQNIQENNGSKALGMKYQLLLDEKSTFVYNNFLGDEKVATPKSRFRSYHNFIYERILNNVWKFQGAFDVGTQSQMGNDGVNTWYATSIIFGQKLNTSSSMGYRLEYYLDRHQSNITTDSKNGFQVSGASVNFDRVVAKDTIWRTESRALVSKDKLFIQGRKYRSRWDGILVTSLAMSF